MTIQAAPPPFRSDSRANRLESWTTTHDRSAGHLLWLRTADAVAAQLLKLAPDYSARQPPPDSTWTHVLRSTGALRRDVAELLAVLGTTLTLSCPATLDFVLALDWYKQPADGVPATSWPNTETGELVHLGKYRYRADGDRQAEVGRLLMRKVSAVIQGHPLLRKTDVVLDVPGHDTERVSFGSRMAATVARDFELPKIRVVLIVDDVFHSGASMGETARAARAAGASQVFGICAVRNRRR